MAYRQEFIEGLTIVGRAIQSLIDEGLEAPVLVGGGAVEFFTGGAVVSGDLDFVTPFQTQLQKALEPYGFEPSKGPWVITFGVTNAELGVSVQVVSGLLMDGRADRNRVRLIDMGNDGAFAIIPVEDLIADRMAQAFAGPAVRKDMLDQAVKLYQLADELDEDYLDRRIREETGKDADLRELKRYVDEDRHP